MITLGQPLWHALLVLLFGSLWYVPNLLEPYSFVMSLTFGIPMRRQSRSLFQPKEVQQQMPDFWAWAGIATCSLARILRGASAR